MSQRALITGISGFVGGYLAEHLLDAGDAVLGVSPDGRWSQFSPTELASCVDVLPWDLSEPSAAPGDETQRQIEDFRPNVIYHLAALSVPANCGRDRPSEAAMAINVEGTARVVAWAQLLRDRFNATDPRLLFTSSSHVYAPVSAAEAVVAETAQLSPRSSYGQTKLYAERIVQRAVRQNRLDAIVTRAFQHAGPRQSGRMMLSEWARQLADHAGTTQGCTTADGTTTNAGIEDQTVAATLVADKGNADSELPCVEVHTCNAFIDLSDVRDVVRAYRLLVERGQSGTIYNVGSGVERRSGDILDMLIRASGSRRRVCELYGGRKQDPIANISRLQKATGWRPQIPVEQTVEQIWQYWKTRSLSGLH